MRSFRHFKLFINTPFYFTEMNYIYILLVMMTPLVSLPNWWISFRKGIFSPTVCPPGSVMRQDVFLRLADQSADIVIR